MTTPNRPPFPNWYQAERTVPPHVGPTQREMLTRRIKSLRTWLLGASLVGVATFTGLAAQHSGTIAAAASKQNANAAFVQQTGSIVSSSTSKTSSTSGAALSAPSTSQFTSSFRTTTRSS